MQGTSWLVNLVLTLFVQTSQGGLQCDMSTTALVQDGNMGESDIFCWVGILRVHLHDGDTTKVALTGVVLIKVNYVIANADDIARIPMHVFKQESQIMFIPQKATPWYCRPLSYTTHPEYEYNTYNTISVIELALDDVETYPLRPICWPKKMMNTSSHLYVTGYTDDNKFLEKVMYKMQFVDQTMCDQFYKKAGLAAESRAPLYYQCGLAANEKENCVWDNGMALISNASGWFTLIGLSVRGPGCAAPARFIDMHMYSQWIEMATSINEFDDYGAFRRSQKKDAVEYVSAQELIKNGSDLSKSAPQGSDFYKYPFDVASMRNFNITQIAPDAYMITPFNNTYEVVNGSCKDHGKLVYSEHFKVQTKPSIKGHVSYKISLYDFTIKNITCIKLMVHCTNKSKAKLYYTEDMDFVEGTSITDSGETPEQLLKNYLMPDRELPNSKPDKDSYLRPVSIESDVFKLKTPTVNLILTFEFYGEVIFKYQMYGRPNEPEREKKVNWRRRLFKDRFDEFFENVVDNYGSEVNDEGANVVDNYSSEIKKKVANVANNYSNEIKKNIATVVDNYSSGIKKSVENVVDNYSSESNNETRSLESMEVNFTVSGCVSDKFSIAASILVLVIQYLLLLTVHL